MEAVTPKPHSELFEEVRFYIDRALKADYPLTHYAQAMKALESIEEQLEAFQRNRWAAFTTSELCDVHHACQMLLKRRDMGSDERPGFERLSAEAWGEHVRRVESNPASRSSSLQASSTASDASGEPGTGTSNQDTRDA